MGSGKSDEIIAQKYFQATIGDSPLVNKLGITNQQRLDEVEAYFVENALVNGLSDTAKILSPNGLKQMHLELFGDIYAWAGCYRDYTTGRGFPFCRPEFIDTQLQKIYQKLNETITKPINQQEFIKISAWFIGELNTIHPFIDGNGRTQRKTLDLIAEKMGFYLNIEKLDKNAWYNSAKLCHLYADFSGFEQMIALLIQPSDEM